MGLIVVAADKGAPGVTTTALALAAVWPRPVLLAECDPAGGDLAFRFPAAGGERLDPRRGMLSLAVAARHGLQPGQLWEHTQKLHGGIDVLLGVTNAEQGAGLSTLWGQIGRVLAAVPQADVIADCGRLGPDGPVMDLLAEASQVLLLTRAEVGGVIRVRDRTVALAAAAEKRGRRGFTADVVVIADQKNLKAELAEVGHVLIQGRAPARVLGGIVSDSRAAGLLRGQWGGKLDKSLLIRSIRGIAGQLVAAMPSQEGAAGPRAAHDRPLPGRAAKHASGPYPPGQHAGAQPVPGQPTGAKQPGQYGSGLHADPEPAGRQYAAGQHVAADYAGGQHVAADYAGGQHVAGVYAASDRAGGRYAAGEHPVSGHADSPYAAGQQAGADRFGGPYAAGQHADVEFAGGRYVVGPLAGPEQADGQYVPGADGSPAEALGQHGPGTRLPGHRYERDARPGPGAPSPPGAPGAPGVPGAETGPDGAAHGQVPQYRGR